MKPETQRQIVYEAEAAARLQFHPEHSRDAFTACTICYRQGAIAYAEKVEQLEQEVERIKDLLKGIYGAFATFTYTMLSKSVEDIETIINEKWEYYKKENNL